MLRRRCRAAGDIGDYGVCGLVAGNLDKARAAKVPLADDPWERKGRPEVELGATPTGAAEVPPLRRTSY